MSKALVSLISASVLTIAACGGGGGGGAAKATSTGSTGSSNTSNPAGETAPTAPPPPDPSNVKGLVFDGPVSGATVICDANRNGLQDLGETTTKSTSTGQFNIACPVGSQLVVLGDGLALDTASKQPMRGVLYGLVTQETQGYTQLNSLTTLAAALVKQGSSISDAENQVRSFFEIPASTSLYGHHPASNANLLNAVLSMQTSLLSAAGEISFVNRAIGSSDNPSVNAVHDSLNSKFATLVGQGSSPASRESMFHQAVQASLQELSSSELVTRDLRALLTNPATASRIEMNAFLGAKIANDTHSAQNTIPDLQIQGLDLTKPLSAAITAKVKAASTWTTRFDPVSGSHYNTTTLPVESTYVDTIAGFMKLDDGSYIDPRLKEDGTYAFPVEIADYDAATNTITILFNRTKDHLNMNLFEEIQFDPFTNPLTGFTVMHFKPNSSPDELVQSGRMYGNVMPNIIKPSFQSISPIGKDNIWPILHPDNPRIAIGVTITLSAKAQLTNGQRIFAMWNDAKPQDNHSFVLINSGQTGKGVSQMVTQLFEVKIPQ